MVALQPLKTVQIEKTQSCKNTVIARFAVPKISASSTQQALHATRNSLPNGQLNNVKTAA
jgi:hypothetical protein